MPTPPPSYIPNKRTRQLQDEQNNWAFVTPDDVIDNYMSQEFLKLPEYGPDGKERNSSSALERFYERLSRGHGVTNRADHYDLWGGQPLNDGQNDTELARNFGGLNESGSTSSLMDEFSNPGLHDSAMRRDALSDLLGLKDNRNRMTPTDTRRERDAQTEQLDAFKKALDFQPVVTPATTFNLPGVASAPNFTWNNNPGTYSATGQRNPYEVLPGAFNPPSAPLIPTIPTLPGVPIVPGQQILPAPLPTLSSTRVGPPKPDFSIPQRRF